MTKYAITTPDSNSRIIHRNSLPSEWESFVYAFGYVNCQISKLKGPGEIIQAFCERHGCHEGHDSDKFRSLLNRFAGEEVLIQVIDFIGEPDCFVCGDENGWPLPIECFELQPQESTEPF